METKIIKCPKCGVVLEVKNSCNEAVKDIKCPNCLTPLKVFFRHPPVQQPVGVTVLPGANGPKQPAGGGATQLGPSESQPGETQLGPKSGSTPPLVKPQLQPGCLVCNGREYPLQMGQNIVGRKNHTKPTTVMLDVDDSYMSRMHICINVEQVGNAIRTTISNYQNTNDTQVAGLPLRNGEVVVLNNGMPIKMGETTIVYRSGTKE